MSNPVPPTPRSGIKLAADPAISNVLGQHAVSVAVGSVAVLIVALIIFRSIGSLVFVAVIAFVAAAVFLGPSMAAGARWHRAEIELPATGLLLGARPQIHYSRASRKAVDVSNATLECQVVCEEWIRHGHGTEAKTDTNTPYQQTFTGQVHGTRDGIESIVTINIPTSGGAPNLDVSDNRISWFLNIRLDGPNMPGDTQRFSVHVLPRLDPNIRNLLGDS